MKYKDGEVLGTETTGAVIQWDADTRHRYTSGETLKEFGIKNLTNRERQRVGLKIMKIKLNQRVYWNDPDAALCSRYATVTAIDGDIITLDNGEVECLVSELTERKPR